MAARGRDLSFFIVFDSFLISFTFLFLALWSAQKAGTQDLGAQLFRSVPIGPISITTWSQTVKNFLTF